MKIFKYLIITLILLVMITVAGFIYQWMGKEGGSFEDLPKIIPDLKVEGIHLTRSIAGRMEWELNAISADIFKEEGLTRLEAPKVVFFGKGDKTVKLTGNKGEVLNGTNDLSVTGDVKIVNSDGYTLTTDSLHYYSDKNSIATDSKVFMKGELIKMEGEGLVADIERNRVTIKKGVKAVLLTGGLVRQ